MIRMIIDVLFSCSAAAVPYVYTRSYTAGLAKKFLRSLQLKSIEKGFN